MAFSPELEIHHINVSQGDSTLIINRNIEELKNAITTAGETPPAKEEDYLPFAISKGVNLKDTVHAAVLIDGGDNSYGEDVVNYLNTHGVFDSTHQLEVVVTHYHSDHLDGLFYLFFTDFSWKKKVNTMTSRFTNLKVYDCGEKKGWVPTTITYLTYASADKNSKLQRNTIAPNDSISLGNDKNKINISLKCIASSGVVFKGGVAGNKDVLGKKKLSPDQNALSVVMVLEYGNFKYFLGGDIGGTGDSTGGNWNNQVDNRTKQFYSSHPDIESTVWNKLTNIFKKTGKGNSIDGHICCAKANHHGSASSNDVFLWATMEPALIACSSGVRPNYHSHPTQQFIYRTDSDASYCPQWQKLGDTTSANPTIPNTIDGYFITEMRDKTKMSSKEKKNSILGTPGPEGKILGDIIVRPVSDITQDNTPISIQVYGTGDLTGAAIAGNRKLLTAASSVRTPYPVGPYDISCNKH